MEVELLQVLDFKKPKRTEEEKRQRQREACKRYYEKNKEYLRQKNLQNYYMKKVFKSSCENNNTECEN